MTRPYTGFDKRSTGPFPGLVALRDTILFLNGDNLQHLGSWVVRDARGKPGIPSVHGTGRATDIGWKLRKDIEPVIDWLVKNADGLGVEFVADYWPKPFGRAWRCDRDNWKNYKTRTIAGAPGGRWIHLEISPTMSSDHDRMMAAITTALGG